MLLSVCKIQAGRDDDSLKIRTWKIDLGVTFLGKSENNTNTLLNTGFNYVIAKTPLYLGVTYDLYYRTKYPVWPNIGSYKQTSLLNTLNLCAGIHFRLSNRISLITGVDYQFLHIENTTKTDNPLLKSYLADDYTINKKMLSYYLRTDVKITEHFSTFLSHHLIQVERPFFSYLTLGISYSK